MARKGFLWELFLIVLAIGVVIYGIFFYFTGGAGLVRVITNYLIPNISNKEFGWSDFIDRGVTYKLSGFYSSSTKNSVSIWTLSGLKTFYVQPGSGEFLYSAICESLGNRVSTQGSEDTVHIGEMDTRDFELWRKKLKPEYFVTVQRDRTQGDYIDMAWSMSGKYNQPKVIDGSTCK